MFGAAIPLHASQHNGVIIALAAYRAHHGLILADVMSPQELRENSTSFGFANVADIVVVSSRIAVATATFTLKLAE
jgi:hypothetical protein